MISTCPRCREQVSIPSGEAPAALVRCPLCKAEYALSEALALAPPELIVVEALVLGESTDASVGVLANSVDVMGIEEIEELATPEPICIEHDHADEDDAATVAKRFPAVSAGRRRRRRPRSALRTLLGLVTSGLAGCLVAYYALALWFGPEFRNVGFPLLPLPGISKIIAPKAGGDDVKPAEKGPPKDKSAAENRDGPDQIALAVGEKTSYSSHRRFPEPENAAFCPPLAPESHS